MEPDCLFRICHFARDYRSERHRTPRQLYEATGYSDGYMRIKQEDIEASMARDPSLVSDWLAFSQDKRWTPAWGLAQRSETDWVVFHCSRNGDFDCELHFCSSIPACALLIRLEMEQFRCDPKNI